MVCLNKKSYQGDLLFFMTKILNNEPFALARFNDGEWFILSKAAYYCYDFQYEPEDPEEEAWAVEFSYTLQESLQWQHDGYYVGIICPHCFGEEAHRKMKEMSGQEMKQLTWGSLLYNANYIPFLESILPYLQHNQNTYMLGNEKGDPSSLPFPLQEYFPLPRNVWKVPPSKSLEGIKKKIEREKIEGALFLICAGPSAAIFVKELCAFCPVNTYIDVGSTFDLWLFKDASRNYLRGVHFTPCQWA